MSSLSSTQQHLLSFRSVGLCFQIRSQLSYTCCTPCQHGSASVAFCVYFFFSPPPGLQRFHLSPLQRYPLGLSSPALEVFPLGRTLTARQGSGSTWRSCQREGERRRTVHTTVTSMRTGDISFVPSAAAAPSTVSKPWSVAL
jgi:hypothetical protein